MPPERFGHITEQAWALAARTHVAACVLSREFIDACITTGQVRSGTPGNVEHGDWRERAEKLEFEKRALAFLFDAAL